MKFKFKTQGYQTNAVAAIVNVFKGQPNKDPYSRGEIETSSNSLFQPRKRNIFANGEIELSDEQLLKNIHEVQGGRIKHSTELSKPFRDEKRFDGSACECRCALDVEMETGTGKTYVYTNAIFELNRRYGWSKFIIVVPSVAIREGVNNSLKDTEEHFCSGKISEEVPNGYGKKIHSFVYDSEMLGEIDVFTSSGIHAMIINAQAFNALKKDSTGKEARKIYEKRDDFYGRRPIDVIASTRPIVILDEPQRLLTATAKATRAGIANFNPLFVMNFSATHRERHDLVYVLDALDAYRERLVKKIEVKGFKPLNLGGDYGFVHLSKIIVDPNQLPRARLYFDIKRKSGVVRDWATVKEKSDLYRLSNGLEEYKDRYIVRKIDPIANAITFLNGLTLASSDVVGDLVGRELRRVQIRETIISHFEKEEKLFKQGIKCLSLFFIDKVKNYREYDEKGTKRLGDYGEMFEDEYESVLSGYIEKAKEDDSCKKFLNHLGIFSFDDDKKLNEEIKAHVGKTHDGYFSIDKNERYIDSVENRAEGGISKDKKAYEKILGDKRILLSLEEPIRFIFSHSALREGWDNPNVFQICTLKQSDSSINKRQEVGRGMRLCVDCEGKRMTKDEKTLDGIILDEKSVHELNVLTVIASESYNDFAQSLQKELEENLYERPTRASAAYFNGKVVKIGEENHVISADEASLIYAYLYQNGYVDKEGRITDKYRNAQEHAPLWEGISDLGAKNVHDLIKGIYSVKEIINSADKPEVQGNSLNDNFYKAEFKELWKRINHKYAYTVKFDSRELVKKAVDAINEDLSIGELAYVKTIGAQHDNDLGFDSSTQKPVDMEIKANSKTKYDLVGDIAKACKLKRITVCAILGSKDKGLESSEYAGLEGISPEKFDLFRRNPVEFIQKVAGIINEQKACVVVDHIMYEPTEEDPYSNEIFTSTVRFADLIKWEDEKDLKDKDVEDILKQLKKKKHITPYTVVDSRGENKLAKELERDETVCVYAKLPRAFKIPTPVGEYAPDWAISFYKGEVKHIYFVAETKGGIQRLDLRPIEKIKIKCTRKLFEQVFKRFSEHEVVYDVIDSYEALINVVEPIKKR